MSEISTPHSSAHLITPENATIRPTKCHNSQIAHQSRRNPLDWAHPIRSRTFPSNYFTCELERFKKKVNERKKGRMIHNMWIFPAYDTLVPLYTAKYDMV